MESNRKYLILVVDDDPTVLDVIQQLLQDDNIETVLVKTSKDAFRIVETIDVHLLITDYFLVNGSGVELIKKLRKNKAHIPVIMISGNQQREVRMKSLEVGANVFLNKPFHGAELKIIVQNLLNLFEANEQLESASDMISALSMAVEKRDSYTQGHHARVTKYSLAIYDEIYGPESTDEREALRIGCMLHDIGKIGIPDTVLKSRTPLTDEERSVVNRHPQFGYDICVDLKSLRGCLDIIKHHHEKLDGSGYPDGLKGHEISNIVAIAAIADIYDALTSLRVYRKKNTPEEALEIMKEDVKEKKINAYFFSILEKLVHENPKEFMI